jgi:hypothetical protein
MRLKSGVLVALVAFSGVAFSGVAFTGAALANDPFASFYDNTIVVTNATGERTVLINKDGTYAIKGADGASATGKWTIEGGNSCFAQDNAPSDAKPYCTATAERKVGDSWELTAPDGTKESATLKAGR